MKSALIALLTGCLFAAAARYVAGGGPEGWEDTFPERLGIVLAFIAGVIAGVTVTDPSPRTNEQNGEE